MGRPGKLGRRPERARLRKRYSDRLNTVVPLHTFALTGAELPAWHRLPGSLGHYFEQPEAELMPEGLIRVVTVPRPAWRPSFECLVVERHTLSCSNFRESRKRFRELAVLLG